jgi:hypothetical protein
VNFSVGEFCYLDCWKLVKFLLSPLSDHCAIFFYVSSSICCVSFGAAYLVKMAQMLEMV